MLPMLIIPSAKVDRPPLSLSMGFTKRGGEGRRIEKAKLDLLRSNREAQMFVVLICTTLWGLFWIQFVLSICWNMPSIYFLSDGSWYEPSLEYYIYTAEPFPWSLAGTFVFISALASSIGLFGGWLWSCGVIGKWRMRFAVLLFALLPTAWSVTALQAENGAWIGLEKDIEEERMFWRSWSYGDDKYWMQHHGLNIERMEKLLESRHGSSNRD